MTQELDQLFGRLWDQYSELNPKAPRIHQLFEDRGDTVLNDHVAFRTFNDNRLGIERIAKPFLDLGYTPQDTYQFEEKKLFARYYAHEDPRQPKVFISELLLGDFSTSLQETVDGLISQLSEDERNDPHLLTRGRLWTVDGKTYETLAEESEYAAWMAAFGFCANHFTVSVNDLDSIEDIGELAELVAAAGYEMNTSGGVIKGSPDVLLEQCSTRATRIEVPFSDGPKEIPSCYYEFAKRYLGADGTLYQGFVAASADKIFESTDR